MAVTDFGAWNVGSRVSCALKLSRAEDPPPSPRVRTRGCLLRGRPLPRVAKLQLRPRQQLGQRERAGHVLGGADGLAHVAVVRPRLASQYGTTDQHEWPG